VHRGLTHIVDFTATIATAAGLEFPAPIDGVDIVSAALGTSASRTSVPINVKETGKNYTAVRFGKWKLIVGSATSYPTINIPNARLENGWFQNGSYPSVEKPPADETGDIYLFDLIEDPNEHIEVSKVNPDVVAEGRAVLAKCISDGCMNIQPNVPNPLSVYVLHNNTWAPFLDTPECVKTVEDACSHQRGNGVACDVCVLAHKSELEAAGCCVQDCGGLIWGTTILRYCSV